MSKAINRRQFLKHTSKMTAAAGVGGMGVLLRGCTSKQEFDLVIKGGRIFDGLGSNETSGDIGIKGNLISQIGKISAAKGKQVLDAEGMAVCPGFIDAHDHSDVGLLVNPKAESHIRQGITTVVSGNCGSSPFPVADEIYEESRSNLQEAYDLELNWRDISGFFAQLENKKIGLNYATYVGQGTIRGAAMGFNDRPPQAEELERMKAMVAENVAQGALGLSSGLEYAPGSYALADEVTELCRAAVAKGGLYATHMRDESDRLLEAMEETIEVARQTGIRIQIAHFKVAYPRNWHKIDDALKKLESAHSEGISLFCDRYPYLAGSSGLSSFNFPLWAKQGTTKEFLARLKDPTLESRLREHVKSREEKLGSWDKVVISSVFTDQNRRFEGQSILQGAEETGKDAFEFMRDLLIEEKDRVSMVLFIMTEDNLKRILAHPLVGIGCDGSALAPYGPLGKGKPHPRSFGTFPRVLGKYVRDEKILPLPEMLKKITSIPAKNFGFNKRGVLQTGYYADLVVFDPERVIDKATYVEPHTYSSGIENVIVNGRLVIQAGEHTSELPGRILRRGST